MMSLYTLLDEIRAHLATLANRNRYGVSADEKPDTANVGDVFHELDTDKIYQWYDDQWNDITPEGEGD